MNEMTAWWNGLSQGARTGILDVLLVVSGLILGRIAGGLTKHLLLKHGVDRYMRAPWSKTESGDHIAPEKSVVSSLTTLFGWLVMLTVWAGAWWLIAGIHHSKPTIDVISVSVVRAWQIAAVVFLAVLASGWLAHTTYALFQAPWIKRELNTLFADIPEKEGSFTDTAARFVCIVIYAAFLLLVPVAVASLFDFGALSALAGPAWQMCARLLCVPVAFAVGYLGIALVRSLGKQQAKAGVDRTNVEYYVGVGITVGTTLLALGLLLGITSGGGAIVMAILLALFLFLLWPVRNNLRDVWAGIMLRLQDAKYLPASQNFAEIKSIGLLVTQLDRDGQEYTRKNSDVLDMVLKSAEQEGPEASSATSADRKPMQEV